MKKVYFYIPALALLAAACQKDNTIPAPGDDNNEPAPVQVEMITETVSGGRGASTKATIADTDASFAWTAGDNVAVHVSNGGTHKYVTTSKGADAAGASAKFEVTYEEGYSRDAFAVYPSTIVETTAANYGQDGHALDVTLPSSYTLAQVQGEVSPGPMIATNTAGAGWNFYQLCGLLRLAVNDIPAAAKRLEIDFNGKKVCGDFSIAAPVTPGSSAVETSDDDNDCITITKDGTSTTLGATSLVLNFPLPVGTYTKITVRAYDALAGGTLLKGASVSFSYSVTTKRAARSATALVDPLSTFKFTFKDNGTPLENVRFARVFSVKNKLHNGATTYGPYTASGNTDLDSPLTAGLRFDKVSDDQLVFQVITGNGKVYSGIFDAPAEGYDLFETFDVTADVTAYTFTVASGKKVYFSPGDLGVDGSVYSFTEPFETWGWGGNTSTSKRVWFNYGEISGGLNICGIDWRNLNTLAASTEDTPKPHEWDKIIARTNMESNVKAYYRVTVSGHTNCLLLPPDETQASDIGEDLTSGTVTDYAKYIGKGFVLLISTGRATYSSSGLNWGMATQGWYWALWHKMSTNRTYFYWTNDSEFIPKLDWAGSQFRMRVRYVRDVE